MKKCCNHRCPDSVYFNTLLLVIYLSAIETLICRRETSLIGSTSFGFSQNTIHDFRNTVFEKCRNLKSMLIIVQYRVYRISYTVLTHYHTMPHFDALKIYSSGKKLRKGEIACNKQFLLFSQCFPRCMPLIFFILSAL